ncbi:ABC transporter permease [Cohnella kolymensis]|uniref:ABC transporter permease n=1 Tax=Cohnella kolymensis TaxID=1590652 RepID=UPI0006982F78|nr:ABC transporter permease [Cohnella kolymensis]
MKSFGKSLNQYLALIILIVIVVVGANMLYPGATSIDNIYSMSTFGVEIGLIALGMTLIIMAGGGGIDLSVGAIYALTQIIAAYLMAEGVNMWAAVGIAILSGVFMGFVNGYMVTKLRIPAIIATLATMYVFNGLALLISNGVNIAGMPEEFAIFGQGVMFGNIPFQFIAIYLPALIIIGYLLSRSLFGYQLYLTGTNDASAKLAGINTDRVRLITYMLTGLLCAIAGIIGSSRLLTARPDAGDIMNLQAVTIAVLGGASIFGGRGTVIGTFLSTIVITLLAYICNLININAVMQTGAIGIILIVITLGQNNFGGLKRLKSVFLARKAV